MAATYLIQRHPGHSFLYRSTIPKDLQVLFKRKQFQLSLRCGLLRKAKALSLHLHNITQQLYTAIRHDSPTIKPDAEKIKDLLRAELDKIAHFTPATIPTQPTTTAKSAAAKSKKKMHRKTTPRATLSSLMGRFIDSRKDRGFGDKTIADYQDSFNLLLEVLGNKLIPSLTHQHARDYVSILKKLPSNRKIKHQNKSIKMLTRMQGLDLFSPRTVAKHVERVSALFNWSIRQGYTKENVFKGKLEPSRASEVLEKHFTQEELDLILGDRLRGQSLEIKKPERYWVTMLAAHSGARLNEICQLDIADIKQKDGVWVMELQQNAADKTIKTKAANRTVPLHPRLLELGLLDYLTQLKANNQQKLFPALKKTLSTGYGTSISNWFARYLKHLGIKKKGKNFHSLRHTVINRLLTKQVYEPFIKELVGHSSGSITVDVYGGRKPADVLLNECVMKI